MESIPDIKSQILAALSHVEAEEGLYFNNFIVLHEDESRPIVEGSPPAVVKALKELITEGKVATEGNGDTTIYKLA